MNSTPRQIVLLGATGSIGTSTVDLVRRYPERFEIVGMTAHRSASELATLADTFGGARLQLTGPGADAALRAERPDLAPRTPRGPSAGRVERSPTGPSDDEGVERSPGSLRRIMDPGPCSIDDPGPSAAAAVRRS